MFSGSIQGMVASGWIDTGWFTGAPYISGGITFEELLDLIDPTPKPKPKRQLYRSIDDEWQPSDLKEEV